MRNGMYMWHDRYLDYNFGADHPFKTIKYSVFRNLLLNNNQLQIPEVQVPGKFSVAELKTFFKPEFIDNLLAKEQQPGTMLDPGTPAFKDMVEVSSIATYGTYYALQQILEGKKKYAFNCLGGHHHGMPDTAAGGCVLNDMGFAIKQLRKEGWNEKIAIIDVDFHPHNGTVAFLKDDERVLLASIHEKGWFGFEDDLYDDLYPNIINIPIKSNYLLSEQEYKNIFDSKIVSGIKSFQPEILIYVNGADGHINDEVTYYGKKEKSISLTDETYEYLAKTMAKLAIELTQGKILGLGAGGYSVSHTANVWFNTLRIFNNVLN